MTFIESADTTIHHLGALETSALGLGCMGLSQGYGPADDGESLSAIHAALDSGITMLDTAMSYGQGHNEEIVGRAVSTSGIARDSLQIATKLGIGPTRRAGSSWMLIPAASPPTATHRCAGWDWRPSTCTTCTAWTRRFRSRSPSQPWLTWSLKARSVISGCQR